MTYLFMIILYQVFIVCTPPCPLVLCHFYCKRAYSRLLDDCHEKNNRHIKNIRKKKLIWVNHEKRCQSIVVERLLFAKANFEIWNWTPFVFVRRFVQRVVCGWNEGCHVHSHRMVWFSDDSLFCGHCAAWERSKFGSDQCLGRLRKKGTLLQIICEKFSIHYLIML